MFLLVAPACGLFAQEYSYAHYDVKDGLSGSNIYSAVEDKEGFMWFATETGLSRFDGTHFKNFTTNDGLPDNEIIKLSVDSKNRVWILPFKNSIAYYWKGRIFNQQNDSTLRKLKITTEIQSVTENKYGDILLQESHCVHFINSHGVVTEMKEFNGFGFITQAVGLNKKGEFSLSLGTDWQNNLIDMDHDKIVGYSPGRLMDYGCLYLYLSHYLEIDRDLNFMYFRPTDANAFTIPLPKGSINVSYLNDSSVILNTYNGSYWVSLDQKKITDSFLKGTTVNAVTQDTEGSLWFSTMGKGLYRLGSSRFVNYFFRMNNNDLPVFAIKKIDSMLYVGTDHFYLWTMDQEKAHVRKTLLYDGMTRGRITAALSLSRRTMVVGTDFGLYLLEDGRKKATYQTLATKSVSVKDDSTLLVCSNANATLIRSGSLKPVDTILNVRSTCGYTKNGLYFIGTLEGLYLIDENKRNGHRGEHNMILRTRITDIKGSADGTVWVATDGAGLVGYKDGKVIAMITERDGLTSNICRTIFISDKDIWVGTDKGLNKISPATGHYKIVSFTNKDGLTSDIVNAVCVEGKDVFVGTSDGLTQFNENGISKRSECNLRITGIGISEKEWPFDTSGFTLPHAYGNIKFDFVGISYKSAGSIDYQYRLKGLDDETRSTSENSLNYPSLPSGAYELQLQAINKFGVRSAAMNIKFTVDKLLWERIWFRALILLTLAALIRLLFNSRVRAIRKKEVEKTNTITRMAELEQMALRSQMNPHFIFNCMNSIQEFVIDKDVLGANEFITKFSNLIRQTLDISTRPVISLHEEINYISTYIELENKRFGNKFVATITTSEDIDRQNFHIPPMILQPYIENAIRHGIGHRQDKNGHIVIGMECRDGRFICVIGDNGIGRRQAYQYKSNNAINYQSMGMTLVARRIEMLNKTNNSPIFIEITDLEDGEGKPAGTKVTLNFPLDQVTK
ncbi:MAG TPA: histidine kinase [Puia sp.]|nr:histidine kinase [Puia sp.]